MVQCLSARPKPMAGTQRDEISAETNKGARRLLVTHLVRCRQGHSGLRRKCLKRAGVSTPAGHQPWRARLPGFFLLRVWAPRSRLRFWPLPVVAVTPIGSAGRGVALRSASVTILLPMIGSGLVKL